ncbi:hypothetical protein LIER_01259 [Lithospermum erythrorhizon]|uniref:RNase H type-1 domain-containing protein n=1 Tax=Lithospermum erythrorhizon TaxID=34254 RepID=A0AAV3NLB5_LITER
MSYMGQKIITPRIDKFAFALVISARKLKIYFESYAIQVVTDQPLKIDIISPQLFRRFPRNKAQALADFIIECIAQPPQVISGFGDFEPRLNNPEWVLYVDGARNEKGSGAGILIRGLDGIAMEYALRFTFPTTNNEAEFEAIVAGLTIASSLGIDRIWVKGDSKLIMD